MKKIASNFLKYSWYLVTSCYVWKYFDSFIRVENNSYMNVFSMFMVEIILDNNFFVIKKNNNKLIVETKFKIY